MNVNIKTKSLRAKKLGILIRDARQAAGKTRKECAEAIGVPNATLGSYERGVKSPTLPVLEVMSFYLGVPMDHFWGNEAISEKPPATEGLDLDEFVQSRQSAIAEQLQAAREAAGMTQKELAESGGIPLRRLRRYEKGNLEIPLPELETLVGVLDKPLHAFRDPQGSIGEWMAEQDDVTQFLSLPQDLREFVSKPINHPYVELAQKLSKMEADKLRAVAEGLLEITL